MEAVASPVSDARLQAALDYWRSKAASRPMPRRDEIDPAEIRVLLPHVMLVEVLGPGLYRYRLIGTENARAHGMNATGRFVHEVMPSPEYRDHVMALYDSCIGQRRPVYSESLFLSPADGAPERHTKVIMLPLAEDAVTVNQVLVLQVFHYIDQQTRDRHFIEARPFKQIVHAVL